MLKTISINTILIFFLLILIPSCGDDPAALMEPVDVTSNIHESVSNLISLNAMILNDESFDLSDYSLTNYISIMTYYYLQTNWGLRKIQPFFTDDLGLKTDNIWIKQVEEKGIDTYFTVSYNADRSPHYTGKLATTGTNDGVSKTISYQINYSGYGTGNFTFYIVLSNTAETITNKSTVSNYASWEVISTNFFKFNLKLNIASITNDVIKDYKFLASLIATNTNGMRLFSFAVTNDTISEYLTLTNTLP